MQIAWISYEMLRDDIHDSVVFTNGRILIF